MRRAGCFTAVLAALVAALPVAAAPRIELDVDATDVVHGAQHAHLVMPVRPGPLTLAYPEWIPGEHRPNGPITQLVNLEITAAGRPLAWRRDPLDAFLFHIDVPGDARELEVRFDYLSPPSAFGPGFGETPNATEHLLLILFNQLLLYPSTAAADAIEVEAKVRIPDGWRFDDALTPERVDGPTISLPAVPLATLVDSPLLAGAHVRTVPLTGGPAPTRMTIAADAPQDLAVGDTVIAALRRLPPEAAAVFGPGHYRRYVWLTALSGRLAHDGVEHHESSDVREDEGLFTTAADSIDWVLFPHEYVHSWNGKYRRPSGLSTRNYQQPMATDLLWVYEGLTRYYGDFVLAARSGLITAEQARAYLAFVAAQMDEDRPGRRWRPLADTATAVPAFADASAAGSALRRGADYYNEMLLVWLEADAAIRRASGGRRSLDDVCRRFFAGPEQVPVVKPYGRADVVEALAASAPLDWNGFLAKRIDAVAPRAPLGGLDASGWTLTYDDRPNPFIQALEAKSSVYDLSHSLGLWVKADGTIQDVIPGSPAYQAGAAPEMRLTAVDGRAWTIDAARDAIVRAERAAGPIVLTAASGDDVRDLEVNHHGGLRYPHLTRIPGRPDLLGEILAPRAAGPPPQEQPQ